MATPSTYAHFENAVPTGDSGLAVGASGSEVTVCDSSGNLYQAGTLITATAAQLNGAEANTIAHATTASIKVAYGQATVDDSKAVNTGLTTVVRCFTNIASASAVTGLKASFIQATYSGATITLKGFRVTNGTSDLTAVANGVTQTVDWVAFGT